MRAHSTLFQSPTRVKPTLDKSVLLLPLLSFLS